MPTTRKRNAQATAFRGLLVSAEHSRTRDDFAQRLANATENFIELAMEIGEFDRDSAVRLLAFYRKHKIVKLDAIMGTFKVKHGALWDREVFLRALAL